MSITRRAKTRWIAVFTTVVACCLSSATLFAQQTDDVPPSIPMEPITAIIDAFQSHRVVALDEGDHRNEPGHRFRLALIRDPRFAQNVNDIVVEFGNSRYQNVMDRFVRGERVAERDFQQVWQNTTVSSAIWDVPIYREFFVAVREVNAKLPKQHQLRVLLGDPPIDWSRVKRFKDVEPFTDRDESAVEIIRREVLSKGRRALVIYGGMHYSRKTTLFALNDPEPKEESANVPQRNIVGYLEAAGTKVFSIWTHTFGEITAIQADINSWPIPSLSTLRGTRLGRALFSKYYSTEGMQLYFTTPEGRGERVVLDPNRSIPMEEVVDAVLYLGPPAGFTYSRLSPALCADRNYIEMRVKRLAIADSGRPADAPASDPRKELNEECSEAMK